MNTGKESTITQGVLKLLVCPECRRMVTHTRDSLRCELCKMDYPINNGIPSLLTKLETQEEEQMSIYEDTIGSSVKNLEYTKYTAKFFFQVIADSYFLPLVFNKGVPGKLVVDIGSGLGNISTRIAQAGAHIVNIDIASKALALAKNRMIASKADFIHGSILKIPLMDSSTDIVVASFVLHHIQDTKMAFSEIKRILKPGGYFICIEPALRLTWLELWMNFFKMHATLKNTARRIYAFLRDNFAKNGEVTGASHGRERRGRRHYFKDFDEYKEVIMNTGLENLKMKTVFLEFLPPRYFESNKKCLVRALFSISDALLRNVSSFSKKGKFIIMEARKA